MINCNNLLMQWKKSHMSLNNIEFHDHVFNVKKTFRFCLLFWLSFTKYCLENEDILQCEEKNFKNATLINYCTFFKIQ